MIKIYVYTYKIIFIITGIFNSFKLCIYFSDIIFISNNVCIIYGLNMRIYTYSMYVYAELFLKKKKTKTI